MLIGSDSEEHSMRVHASTDIAVTPARLFDYVTTLEHVKRWQPDVVETRSLTEGGCRVGARWRATVEEPRRGRFEVETWVIAMAANEHIVCGFDEPTSSGQIEYRMTSVGPGTRVQATAELRIKGFARWFSLAAKGFVRRKFESRLRLLREAVELEQHLQH